MKNQKKSRYVKKKKSIDSSKFYKLIAPPKKKSDPATGSEVVAEQLPDEETCQNENS